MSYARWGESDVYVFAHVSGFVECCGCSFEFREVEPYENFFGQTMDFEMGSAQLHSPAEVVAHMRKHVEAAHDVPERLLDESLYPASDFLPYNSPEGEAQRAVEATEQAQSALRILAALDAGEITPQEVLDYVENGQNPKLAALWFDHPLNKHEGNDIFDIFASLKEDDEAAGYEHLAQDPEYQSDLEARRKNRGGRRLAATLAKPGMAEAVAELEREAASGTGTTQTSAGL